MLAQETADQIDAQADRIDVPGGDFHAAVLSGSGPDGRGRIACWRVFLQSG
jgi:hypothetical protein